MNLSNFLKSKLKDVGLKLNPKLGGREGVSFLTGTNEIYLQSINLDKERSVKIQKQDLGEPKDNLWVALVLMMDNEPISFYLIPSKTVTTPDDFLFVENEVSSFPQLSNWEIKVFKNGMQKLSEFSLENMLDKLN